MNEHRPSPPVTYESVLELLETVAGHLDAETDRHTQAAATVGVRVDADNTQSG